MRMAILKTLGTGMHGLPPLGECNNQSSVLKLTILTCVFAVPDPDGECPMPTVSAHVDNALHTKCIPDNVPPRYLQTCTLMHAVLVLYDDYPPMNTYLGLVYDNCDGDVMLQLRVSPFTCQTFKDR